MTWRHFALAGKILTFLTKARVLSIGRWTQGRTPHLFGTGSQNCCFELPAHFGEAGCPLNASVSVLPPQNDSGSPAPRPCTVARTSSPRATSGTTSPPVCALPLPWPGRDVCAPPGDHRSAQLRVTAHRRLSCFHQQKAQKRTAIFALALSSAATFLTVAASNLLGMTIQHS